MKNIFVGQSGGATAVINASLAGVIAGAIESGKTIFGLKHGLEGLLRDEIVELNQYKEQLEVLKYTPAMALGSCRFKLPEVVEENYDFYEGVVKKFVEYDVDSFIYIGGNDSMDTVDKLNQYFTIKELKINAVGVPKTIDNDLVGMDHTPGFGSACKYLAQTVKELEHDSVIYKPKNVMVIEVMGRNAGWLTLGAALPKLLGSEVPYIVMVPEISFDKDEFIEKVREHLKSHDTVMVIASEGLKDQNGNLVAVTTDFTRLDGFGHPILGGVGQFLENTIKYAIGCRTRSVELSTAQRSAAHILSLTDVTEAYDIGRKAIEIVKNNSGVVMCINRVGEYKTSYDYIDVSMVANKEKKVPTKLLDFDNEVSVQKILKYILPLIKGQVSYEYENGLVKFFKL